MTRAELAQLTYEQMWSASGLMVAPWSELAPHLREKYAEAGVMIAAKGLRYILDALNIEGVVRAPREET